MKRGSGRRGGRPADAGQGRPAAAEVEPGGIKRAVPLREWFGPQALLFLLFVGVGLLLAFR